MLPRVFEMFTQADATLERSRGGLGLGLALARQLIEMHGGSVTARSEGLGRGSEFTVQLPGIVVEAPRPAPAPATPAPGIARVLVVDDNRDAALSLEMLFGLHGIDVHIAHDGPTAIRKAAAGGYDAILLDIGMPAMNGYDVCREMRRQPWGAAVPILAMTGWGQEEDRRKSKEAGFDDHLVKPVDHASLLAALGRRLAAAPPERIH
jgi:CheY-like chemotaxis protein